MANILNFRDGARKTDRNSTLRATSRKAVNDSNVGITEVDDICRKVAAKRSESEGNSDVRGRRGQQQHRLRLRCDFVAASGVSCSKGVAAIGGRRGSDVYDRIPDQTQGAAAD
ncbi:hypothetical protein BHE74_00029790 [Ensete ventricosum]|nr:hypothetical protein BHE74_00029790 [Ensete ventricosum]